jgi:hypothetical protein
LRRSLLESPTAHGLGTELWTLKRARRSFSEVHG